jgi:hypothetical protein
MPRVIPQSLRLMRARAREGRRWAAYANHRTGHLQFLLVGDGCTYNDGPSRYPDWAPSNCVEYLFAGHVNVDTGEIVDE